MTFVYRQLKGIAERFEPVVLTAKRENPDLFPFHHVVEAPAPPPGIASRVRSKLSRMIHRQYSYTTREQLAKWAEACKAANVSMIHAHFGYGGLQMLPLAESLRLPLLVSFHGNDASSFLRNTVYAENVRHLLKHAHVICVSEVMRKRLQELGPALNMLPPHYYGVPVDDFPLAQRKSMAEKLKVGERIEFLQIANLVEKKGHAYTLRAFRNLLAVHSNVHLTLGGSGELRADLERLAADLGISDKVTFAGTVTHASVVPMMHRADVFLHHSVTGSDGSQEGIPNVIMEAMCTGLPVISTRHAGIPELVEDGVDGFLVKERDVESYCARMIDVMERGQEISRNARRKILSRFNLEVQNARLADAYSEIMRDRHN